MATTTIKGKDKTIAANGINVCYDDFGTGQMPLIFIHGFPFDKSSWEPQMTALKKTQRVIAYDIRGFGSSSAGTEKVSISLFADDLVRFMEALEIEKAIVCGSSMGGYILLNAVQRYTNRFEALILTDTQCIADKEEVREKRRITIADIEANGLKSFTEGFLENIFTQKSLDTDTDLVQSVRNTILSTPPETVTNTLAALADRSETCSMLKEISVPTRIICGREDKVTPLLQSEVMRSEIAGATLHVIEHAGHVANLEKPNKFNKILLDFVNTYQHITEHLSV